VLDAAAEKARIVMLDAPPRPKILTEIKAAAARGLRPIELTMALVRTMRGPGRLTAHEYFYYQLYDPALARDETLRFVGKRAQQAFHNVCNDTRWFAVTHDKALFYAVARGADLPTPQTLAVYSPGSRNFAARTLRTQADLADFLHQPDNYPLFVKPIVGMYSVGAMSLAAIEDDEIRLTTGETAQAADVVRFISEFGQEGFLLQRRLAPHPLLRQIIGQTLPTIRFLVLLGPEGATIESAVVKIPVGRNPADNFWRTGNMVGALDASGVVTRVVTGVGGGLRHVTEHPDTGFPLLNLPLPDWQQAQELCRTAAGMFPGVRTQSWDVGLSADGPLLLEFNFGGDLNLHQLAHRRGALTPPYIEHLRRCGYRFRLPA
jgi:hypothetical protein